MEKRGRTGKKGVGWHPGVGDTRVKAIKSDSDSDSDEQKKLGANLQRIAEKKGRQVFQEKNSRVTPSVAAPGVTHPSDATDNDDKDKLKYSKSYNVSPAERSLIAED